MKAIELAQMILSLPADQQQMEIYRADTDHAAVKIERVCAQSMYKFSADDANVHLDNYPAEADDSEVKFKIVRVS